VVQKKKGGKLLPIGDIKRGDVESSTQHNYEGEQWGGKNQIAQLLFEKGKRVGKGNQ